MFVTSVWPFRFITHCDIKFQIWVFTEYNLTQCSVLFGKRMSTLRGIVVLVCVADNRTENRSPISKTKEKTLLSESLWTTITFSYTDRNCFNSIHLDRLTRPSVPLYPIQLSTFWNKNINLCSVSLNTMSRWLSNHPVTVNGPVGKKSCDQDVSKVWLSRNTLLLDICEVRYICAKCRGACRISERMQYSKLESRDFESLRDLAMRRPPTWWIEAQVGRQIIWSISRYMLSFDNVGSSFGTFKRYE